MVEVRYKARLGNNLFQYSLGRIIAEELGFALQADPIPGFPNTAQAVTGAAHEGSEQILSGQRIDLANVLADKSPRRVILDGWFQCHELYRPYRGRIREWLAIDPSVQAPDVEPGIVVNVRRTDYIQLGWALPFSYYEQAIERLLPSSGGSLWIVTDDPADPFFWQFRRWKPKFFNGNPLEQILFMTRAPRLVMSQSTFSWWPAFLAERQDVACPLPSFGCWAVGSTEYDIDLIDRNRFECIECAKPYEASSAEALYQRWRVFKRRVISKLIRDFGLQRAEPPP
jgi:hypothetical protein